MFRPSSTRSAIASAGPDVATVTDLTFLTDTAGDVALVDFWAPWCAPCRAFSPIFQDAAQRHARDGFRFGSCNVDANPDTARLLGIQTIPTVVAFDRAGNEVERLVSVLSPHELESLARKAEGAR